MPTHWLHYWKTPQVRRGLADVVLAHIASGQFGRVSAGDRIWIVNATDEGELITIGYVDATEPVSMAEARRRLEYEPWEATYHILVDPASAQRARLVSLAGITEKLRFDSSASDRLRLTNGRVNGQQLQTMRRLTLESAQLLESAWARGQKSQDDEYAEIDRGLAELGELDQRREVLVRGEQRFLRKYLFGAEGIGTCALCAKEFPIGLLIAAHIKRRADCSDEERRDYVNNVAPMCVLGCDALFERGYVFITNGIIRRRANAVMTDPIRAYVNEVVDQRCEMWNPGNASYFSWHAVRPFKGTVNEPESSAVDT